MSLPLLLALGVGGVAVVAGGGDAKASVAKPAPSATKLPSALRLGIRRGTPIKPSAVGSIVIPAKPLPKPRYMGWPYSGTVTQSTGPGATTANAGEIAARAATDKLKAEAMAAYNSATAEAKCAMVDAVNKKYNLKLDCKSTPFNAIVTAVTGAAGAAAGTALCGPPCSVVGGIVGTWVGNKLGPFATAKWAKIEDWAGDVYDDAADWAGDKASDAYDYVTGLF